MKNILIGLLLIVQGTMYSQTMTWIPSKHVVNKGCIDMTNCDENIVCYKLQYIPNESGVLTSYTTGFIADCENGETKVKINKSCIIEDKSDQVVACESYGKILLNCSGNSGATNLEKGRPIILHQICLDAKNKNIAIVESDIIKLTTSIDVKERKAKTEFADYVSYMALNSIATCDDVKLNLELGAHLELAGNILLEWEPAKETIDGFYTLQRSYKGESFEDVYSVISQVISASSQGKYEFLDEGLDYGDYRYRVIYSDENGNVFYSNVADIFYKNRSFSLVIYPNPAVKKVNVFITAPNDEVNLSITDMNGIVISRQLLITDTEHSLNLSKMIPGLYSISIYTREQTISKKLVLIE